MNYTRSLIAVADDCPVSKGVAPEPRPMESKEYQRLVEAKGGGVKVLKALRSSQNLKWQHP